MICQYIDSRKDEFGVEPICQVLTASGIKIAPSTYYAAKTRPPSARSRRDMLPLLFSFADAGRHTLFFCEQSTRLQGLLAYNLVT